MNCKFIPAFVVFLLVFASLPVARSQECGPRPRLISVTGTAEINVAPDQVTLSLGVETSNRDLGIAKSQHDSRVKKALALAKSAGIDAKDVETSSLRMGPDYSEEKIPKFLGYQVSQTMVITLKDLSKYETLMTKLLEGGINHVNSINFGLGETRKYKDEARTKAIRSAKEKAVAMAAELGQTVGKPWDVSEQGGSNAYRGLANSTSYGYNNPTVGADESTVAPGQVAIQASVVVSFQLE